MLTSSQNPAISGTSVTLSAVVTASLSTASGTVTFYDGSTAMGSATLSNGAASLTISSLGVGTHALTAVYSGDATHTASTSPIVNEVIFVQVGTSTNLSSSQNPAVTGVNITLTATVAPSTATGTVTFYDGSTSIGTSALSGGTAFVGLNSLAPGTHALTAAYSGDTYDVSSTSPVLHQVISTPTAGSGISLSSSRVPQSWDLPLR